MLGGYYADEALPWSAQDVCNWLPTNAEVPGTQTPGMLKTPPGLKPAARLNDPGTIVRGTYNAEGKFFAVIDDKLYQLSNNFILIPLGTVPGTGRVRFAHNQILNGNEVVVVNGNSGYVYNTVTLEFERITDEGYPGGIDALFLDGYIVQIEPQRRYAFNSEVRQATEYNTLDRMVPEAAPDLIQGMAVFNGELVLFGERTTEFFQNTGATEQPFRSKGISFDIGAAARYGIASMDGTVYWLGHDGMFYRLNSYSPERISNRAIEEMVREYSWTNCFAFSWVDSGHSVMYWTFPSGFTIGFDASIGQWHRRASYGLNRWRVNSMTYWRQAWYAGDCLSGALYKVDWDYMLEDDTPFESERWSQVLHDDMNRVFIPRLELIFSDGQAETTAIEFGEQPEAPVISGDAPDGILAQPYPGYTYGVTGGTPPYVFTTRPGSNIFETGLSMNTSGTIGMDTVTKAGTFTHIPRVTDANGLWDELTDAIVVGQAVFASYPVDAPPSDAVMIGGAGGSWSAENYTRTGAGGTNTAGLIDSYDGRLFAIGNGYGYVSLNTGETWAEMDGTPALIPASIVKSGDEWLFFYYDGRANLYYSTDGVVMQSRAIGFDHFWFGSAARGDNVVLSAGVDGLLYSNDAGQTWQATDVPDDKTTYVVVDEGSRFVTFGWVSNGDAYVSTNGASWTQQNLPNNNKIVGAAVGNGYVICVDSDGLCFRRAIGGNTWSSVGSTGGLVNNDAISFHNQMIFANGLFLIGGSSGKIWTSTDGETWTQRFNGGSGLVVSMTPWRPQDE